MANRQRLEHLSTENESKQQDCKENTQTSMLEWTTRSEHVLHFLASHKASGTLKDNTFLSNSLNHCKTLFERDGEIILIDNCGKRELCDSYPIKIIIPKAFIEQNANLQNRNLSQLFDNACYARAFQRFIVPVIFLPNNACIARSATLSSSGELLFNKSSTFVANAINYNDSTNTTYASPIGNDLDILRSADIKLLKSLNIKFICDLMVEKKKKFGFGGYGMKIASSEKADKAQRYKSFHLNCIPYPGCELFKIFKKRNHNGTDLMPVWDDPINDAVLSLDDGNNTKCKANWNQYKKWDIVQLTQRYLRLILDYVQISFASSFNSKHNNNTNVGILIHCVCGWDRTPLFISLIRLSLWADGVIHCELSPSQILYLTLTYDWLLYTHKFGFRLKKGEHIFQFAFYMLQWIINDRYSIFYTDNNGNNGDMSQREDKLMEVYVLFNKIYTQVMEINKPPKYATNNHENGVNGLLKNILPKSIVGDNYHATNHKKGDDLKLLQIFSKLVCMGFDDQIAMEAAKQHPNDVESALSFALKQQDENVNLQDSHK